MFFDRENGVSRDQSAEANGRNSFDRFGYFGDNSQKQAFESNVNGGNIGANSRSAFDSGNWQGSGIGSQNSQANGFSQESNSGSQSSQRANLQGGSSSSGFSRSSSSFQNSKRGNRQNSSENRTNTNADRNSAATRTINDNNWNRTRNKNENYYFIKIFWKDIYRFSYFFFSFRLNFVNFYTILNRNYLWRNVLLFIWYAKIQKKNFNKRNKKDVYHLSFIAIRAMFKTIFSEFLNESSFLNQIKFEKIFDTWNSINRMDRA